MVQKLRRCWPCGQQTECDSISDGKELLLATPTKAHKCLLS